MSAAHRYLLSHTCPPACALLTPHRRRALTTCTHLARLLVAIAQRYPVLSPSVHAALRQLLVLTPTIVDAAALSATRDNLVDRLVDVALCGYGLPILTFARAHAATWDPSSLKRLLARAVTFLESPLAFPMALELVRTLAASQARLVRLLPEHRTLNPGDADAASFSSVSDELLPKLKLLLRDIHAAHVTGAGFASAGSSSAARGEMTGAALSMPPEQRAEHLELRALLTTINETMVARGVL